MDSTKLIPFIFTIALSIALIVIQMFLSTRKNAVLCAILPVLNFAFSIILLVFNIFTANEDLIVKEAMIQFLRLNLVTIVFVVISVITKILKRKYD